MHCDSEIPHPTLAPGFRELAPLLTGIYGIRLIQSPKGPQIYTKLGCEPYQVREGKAGRQGKR